MASSSILPKINTPKNMPDALTKEDADPTDSKNMPDVMKKADPTDSKEQPTMFQTLTSTTTQAVEQVQSFLNNPCLPLKTDSIIMNTAIYLGEIIGSDILRRIIPTIVENKPECVIPPATDLLSSMGDNIINVFSLYVVFSLVLQNIIFGEYRVIILTFLITSFLIAPIVLGTLLYSVRYAFPKSREELPLRIVALAGSALPFGFLLFIALQIAFMIGYEGLIVNLLLTLFVGIPAVTILTSLTKFLAPISILLLGPGVIPYIAGQSFLEFCG